MSTADGLVKVTIRIDAEHLAWAKEQGQDLRGGYNAIIRRALEEYRLKNLSTDFIESSTIHSKQQEAAPLIQSETA